MKTYPVEKCKRCSVEFEKRSKNKVFCNQKCAIAWHNEASLEGKRMVIEMRERMAAKVAGDV